MSFILDALKKSDQERRLGHIPKLDGLDSRPARPRKALFPSIVVLVLVAVTGLSAVWFFNRDTADPQLAKQDPAPGSPTPTAPAARPEPVDGPPPPPSPAQPISNTGIVGLTVNVVSYSPEPAKRFVMINQSIYREHQGLPNGAVVEEITRDGPVLSLNGRRILLRP